MRREPLPPGAASIATQRIPEPVCYLTNNEAAAVLRLSPRTLEKRRVIGGGPRFRKFGRRVMYAIADLHAWADAHTFEATCDPEYAAHRARITARGR